MVAKLSVMGLNPSLWVSGRAVGAEVDWTRRRQRTAARSCRPPCFILSWHGRVVSRARSPKSGTIDTIDQPLRGLTISRGDSFRGRIRRLGSEGGVMEKLNSLDARFVDAEDEDEQTSMAIASIAVFEGPTPSYEEFLAAIA